MKMFHLAPSPAAGSWQAFRIPQLLKELGFHLKVRQPLRFCRRQKVLKVSLKGGMMLIEALNIMKPHNPIIP
jgi:hypothetical protein